MTNRRNKRRRLSRLEGAAMEHGGYLSAAFYDITTMFIGLFNSDNTLEQALQRSRAVVARRNYIETGSATRWGTCPRTMTYTVEGEEEAVE